MTNSSTSYDVSHDSSYRRLVDCVFDIDIEFEKIGNLNLMDVICWEELQMTADIANIAIDENMLKFLMVFSLGSPKIFNIIEYAFKEKDLIVNFNSDVHCIESIYCIYNSDVYNKQLSLLRRFFSIQFDNGQYAMNYFDKWHYQSYNEPNKRQLRYRLINIIFDKYPIAILKFYNKWRKYLHSNDFSFVKYIYEKTKKLALNDSRFSDVYKELEKEIKLQQSMTMYLK